MAIKWHRRPSNQPGVIRIYVVSRAIKITYETKIRVYTFRSSLRFSCNRMWWRGISSCFTSLLQYLVASMYSQLFFCPLDCANIRTNEILVFWALVSPINFIVGICLHLIMIRSQCTNGSNLHWTSGMKTYIKSGALTKIKPSKMRVCLLVYWILIEATSNK